MEQRQKDVNFNCKVKTNLIQITKHVGLMQQHILNKTRTVNRERSVKTLAKSLKNVCEVASF